jgi:hypothetical protein
VWSITHPLARCPSNVCSSRDQRQCSIALDIDVALYTDSARLCAPPPRRVSAAEELCAEPEPLIDLIGVELGTDDQLGAPPIAALVAGTSKTPAVIGARPEWTAA